ncbi:hypothetical protein ACXYMT_01245 [Salinimicrobium sp. CAU 1759]
MKIPFLPLLLVFFLFSCSSDGPSEEKEKTNPEPAEKYYNSSKNFSSQAEVDAFAENEFTVITGNLSFTGESTTDPIVDLNGLSSIKSVRGDLSFLGTQLENLNGLENLNLEKDAWLTIINNPLLVDISALQSITADLTTIELRGSPLIESLHGLEGITSVYYILSFSDLDNLNNIQALSNIKSKVEYVHLTNTEVTNTEGLANIPEVKWLEIGGNSSLTSINMPGLKKAQFISIGANPSLENLNGLTGLEEVSDLKLVSNHSLTNLDGLENLGDTTKISLRVISNSSLQNFCGLQEHSVSGWNSFEVRDNAYNPTPEQLAGEECKI